MVTSTYIHIPYCSAKCHYCSFVSFPDTGTIDQYLDALIFEIESNYKGECLDTLYLGGGTPSILSVKQLNNIIKLFNTNSSTEITTELNPENLSYDYLSELYDCGVNRISLGCQTFDDDVLRIINRRHDKNAVLKSVINAQKIGFKNISLDFIYGLPKQKMSDFVSDLEKAISLGIQHISLYGLKIEQGCYFYTHQPDNIADDDIQADMYLRAVELLTEKGFEHYEISNFSKLGFNSRHNTTYWKNEEYYGFGVSAHGYENGIRYANTSNLYNYLSNPLEKSECHELSRKEKLEEEIFLGFRLMRGISTKNINNKFNIDFEQLYKNMLTKYTNLKLLEKTSTGYKLTTQGILVSNVLLSDFLLDEDFKI